MAIRTVADALGESVFVAAESTLQQASALMLDAGTEAAVVILDGGSAGLLTADDIARALAEGHDTTRTAVAAIAEREPLLARVDEPLLDAHRRMRDAQQELAVVVDGDGEPLGLVEL